MKDVSVARLKDKIAFLTGAGITKSTAQLWAPKASPQSIVTRIMKTEPMQKCFRNASMEPTDGPPAQFHDRSGNDVEKWKHVVRETNVPTIGDKP
jgi:hypothetical protein